MLIIISTENKLLGLPIYSVIYLLLVPIFIKNSNEIAQF